MPLSTEITLPIHQPAAWPDRCIRCDRASPTGRFRFWAWRSQWDQVVTLSSSKYTRPVVEAPACNSCAGSLRLARLGRGLLGWCVFVPVAVAILYLLHRLGLLAGPNSRYLTAGATVILAIPYIAFVLLRPPMIDATARGETIDYRFRNAGYAAEFFRINSPPGPAQPSDRELQP